MTMPTVIHNHKKKEIETKLAKIYSVMNQAIMLSEAEHGDKKYWNYYDPSGNLTYEDSLNWYNKYLAKYIKTTKVEKSISDSEVVYLYFADGSILAIAPWCTDMVFYLNKKAVQNKNLGVSSFNFRFQPILTESQKLNPQNYVHHLGKGFEPYMFAWDGTIEGLYSTLPNSCQPEKIRTYCTKIIQLNGWKIPDDYPLKF